jgi:predicted DNA-binding WGR domain protein
MSNWTVHLEFQEGTSSKFWRARVEGGTLYVNYGKIGSAGQTQVKDFGTPDAANKEYDKLVKEKRKKGYADAGSAPAPADDDEDVNDEDEDGEDEDEEEEAPKPKRAAVPAPASVAPAAAAPAARPAGGLRLVLESGNRKVETYLYLSGTTVRMDSTETYASPDAAKKAHERLKKMLLGEGYKES